MKTFFGITLAGWIKLAIVVALLAGMYYSAVNWLIRIDWPREDYNYAYIIPVVAIYLFWEKRKDFKKEPDLPTWAGYIFIFIGFLLFWLGELSGEFFSQYLSFWLLLVGISLSNWGWRKLKTVGFAVLILLAMFPPPHFLHNQLTLRLKLISSEIGVAMLQGYGLSAYREGNVIDLGFTQLQVVDACSGLRYLFPLLIMGVLLAYIYRAAWWKKALLVISAVPLTIVTNSLRIAMTGILYEVWGSAVADDFFHGFSGWLIFIFGLAMLLGEMWVLSGFRPLRALGALKEKQDGLAASFKSASHLTEHADSFDAPNEPNAPNAAPAPKWLKAFLSPPQFTVAVILLGITLALAQGVEFREKIPISKSFDQFPLQVGEWVGKRDVMEEKFVKELDLSGYIIVNYVNGAQAVNLYTAYYESQRKGESIHSPETCLPGSGWEFKNAGSVTLPLKSRDGKPMRVNKAFMEKGAYKQLSYFWFPQRDRVLTNAWELKVYNFWGALTRQRTDGALVRLITPVYPNESVEDADKRLVAFIKEIVPVLNEFLPK